MTKVFVEQPLASPGSAYKFSLAHLSSLWMCMGKELEGLLSRMAWESATILARSADSSEHSWSVECRV